MPLMVPVCQYSGYTIKKYLSKKEFGSRIKAGNVHFQKLEEE
jgi:hypothetical protein